MKLLRKFNFDLHQYSMTPTSHYFSVWCIFNNTATKKNNDST